MVFFNDVGNQTITNISTNTVSNASGDYGALLMENDHGGYQTITNVTGNKVDGMSFYNDSTGNTQTIINVNTNQSGSDGIYFEKDGNIQNITGSVSGNQITSYSIGIYFNVNAMYGNSMVIASGGVGPSTAISVFVSEQGPQYMTININQPGVFHLGNVAALENANNEMSVADSGATINGQS